MRLLSFLLFFLSFGTFAQIYLATDPNPGVCGNTFCSTQPEQMVVLNDTMYFVGWEHNSTVMESNLLYRYDGVNEAAIIFDNLFDQVDNLTVIDSLLLFCAKDIDGWDVWKYNGFSAPTPITDFNGSSSTIFRYFTSFLNKVYFSANLLTGSGLLVYDPISEITSDVTPSNTPITPQYLHVFHDTLFFMGYDNASGFETWIYDGVTTPHLMFDIQPGVYGAGFYPMANLNGNLLFVANTSTYGSEIWMYDGASFPFLVHDINPGQNFSNPSYPVLYNNELYFSADDGVHGSELWKYDGINTPVMISDINPTNSSFCTNKYVHDNVLYMNAETDSYGSEVWEFNGSGSPTLYDDFYPGPSGSSPRDFITYNNKLYFAIADSLNEAGYELHFISTNASLDEYSNDFKVYPNPTTDLLHFSGFELGIIQPVRVLNLMGELVDEVQLRGDSIDVSHLSSGVYLLEIDGGMLRFVKE